MFIGDSPSGGVAERSNAAVLKTAEVARLPWVRIPPPPHFVGVSGYFVVHEKAFIVLVQQRTVTSWDEPGRGGTNVQSRGDEARLNDPPPGPRREESTWAAAT